MKKLPLLMALLVMAGTAQAEDAAPPQLGPTARPVTAKDEKGVAALYKAFDAAMKARDVEALAALHDFPVYMSTDDNKGTFWGMEQSKESWIKDMTPIYTAPPPKDLKHEWKQAVHFLSNDLAVVIETHSQKLGKDKSSWTSASTVIKKNGKWLFKTMTEAGWAEAPADAAK